MTLYVIGHRTGIDYKLTMTRKVILTTKLTSFTKSILITYANSNQKLFVGHQTDINHKTVTGHKSDMGHTRNCHYNPPMPNYFLMNKFSSP